MFAASAADIIWPGLGRPDLWQGRPCTNKVPGKLYKQNMNSYDIAVIGAGAAGCMAAIRAGQLNKRVILLEKNEIIGKKILMTGRGRCNLTNSGKLDTFIEKFGKRPGQFLRNAFYAFSNEDVMDFFRSKGLDLKSERQGRVNGLLRNGQRGTRFRGCLLVTLLQQFIHCYLGSFW